MERFPIWPISKNLLIKNEVRKTGLFCQRHSLQFLSRHYSAFFIFAVPNRETELVLHFQNLSLDFWLSESTTSLPLIKRRFQINAPPIRIIRRVFEDYRKKLCNVRTYTPSRQFITILTQQKSETLELKTLYVLHDIN